MKWFEDWTFEGVSLFLFLVLSVTVVGVGVRWFFAPKEVDYYYLSHGGDGGRHEAAACVYAHWTWHTDELSLCTDDTNKALDFVAKANGTLKR